MNGIIDGKPAWDDRGSLAAQKWVNVYVNFPYGIISTVGVMVQHCDLQRLILQVLIINLTARSKSFGDVTKCKTLTQFILSELCKWSKAC